MAHQQVPNKARLQKAENNKVMMLANAEYIIVLLSLPFSFNKSCKERVYRNTDITYTSLSTLDSH